MEIYSRNWIDKITFHTHLNLWVDLETHCKRHCEKTAHRRPEKQKGNFKTTHEPGLLGIHSKRKSTGRQRFELERSLVKAEVHTPLNGGLGPRWSASGFLPSPSIPFRGTACCSPYPWGVFRSPCLCLHCSLGFLPSHTQNILHGD